MTYRTTNNNGLRSRYRGQDSVRTPAALYAALDLRFGFTLDVAADPARHMTPTFFTEQDDGLVQPWAPHTCWLNPPSSAITPWLVKTVAETRRGATVVALLPVRTSVAWFHELVLPYAEVEFIRGRLRWENHRSTAPFDSMVCIYEPE